MADCLREQFIQLAEQSGLITRLTILAIGQGADGVAVRVASDDRGGQRVAAQLAGQLVRRPRARRARRAGGCTRRASRSKSPRTS